MSEEYDFLIDVPVRNEWENVSLLVTSVQNCFNAMFANVKGSRTVALVTSELLENAIKYGSWADKSTRLRLGVKGSREAAQIRVENPSTPEAYNELRKNLDWLAEFANAEAAYRARLLALATTDDPETSQLGLVRIAYEGRCRIDAEYEAGRVCVTASLTL